MKSDHDFQTPEGRCCVHLRIMATSDLHMNILPYDYLADRDNHRIGLARTASLIRARRGTAANSLLFDIGDTLQGTPMGDLDAALHGSGPRRGVHPMIKAMNQLDYDAATVGNHDFNYGLPYLESVLNAARHPVTGANLHRTGSGTGAAVAETRDPARGNGEPAPLFPPYLILPRVVHDVDGKAHAVNFGILGFLPPQTTLWEAHLAEDVGTSDILDAARRWLPELRARGADVVIALCHSGIGDGQHVAGGEHAAAALAALDGIDVVLAGHSHQLFPTAEASGLYAAFDEGPAPSQPDAVSETGPSTKASGTTIAGIDTDGGTLFGKPAVLPGSNGSHLGIVDVALEQTDSGWVIAEHRTELAPIFRTEGPDTRPTVDSCDRIIGRVAKDHARVLSHMRQKVGRSDHRLHTYFARLMPDPVSCFIAGAQRRFLTRRLAGGPHDGLPVLSASAPFRAGGLPGPQTYTDVAAGDISLRNVADLYAYPNRLGALCVSGAAVVEWLECAVSAFHQIQPGSTDLPLLRSGFPSYNFEMLAPLEFRIDLSKPARYDAGFRLVDPGAYRIRDLRYQDTPVQPRSRFVLAASDYRINLVQDARRTAGLRPAQHPDIGDPQTVRDVLLDDLRTQDLTRVCRPNRWSFVPMPDTSVLFQTAPQARECLDDIGDLRLADEGDLPNGFAQFRLQL